MLASGPIAMGKKKTEIQIRKEKEEEKIAAAKAALTKAKKTEKASRIDPRKRKDVFFLTRYLAEYPGGPNALRSRGDYVARTYNLGRQVTDLVDYLYVRYRVPTFLYRSMLSRKGIELVFGDGQRDPDFWRECSRPRFVRWFFLAAQGGSVAKDMADLLTKKEVHWFMQAPMENTIERNLFWAKCAAAGVPGPLCQFLTDAVGSPNQQKALGERMGDLVRFYANECGHMRQNDLREITDFVRAMIEEPGFSFKGRTFGSMVKLSNDWHRYTYSAKVTIYRSWTSAFGLWEHRLKGAVVRATELTNNRALADEGKRQRHCVFSYASACGQGYSRIVSMRWMVPAANALGVEELNRLTLEIHPRDRAIVQIRGRQNRGATDEEMKIIRLWAGEHGLVTAGYAR